MFKISALSIAFFWLAKYLVFYLLLMVKQSNFALLEVTNINNKDDLLYYLWLFLFLPVTCTLFYSIPIYASFKAKNIYLSLIVFCLILITEYLFYTWMASQSDFLNGAYNSLVGIAVFYLFFFKELHRKFVQ
jgi:hypothetical protein